MPKRIVVIGDYFPHGSYESIRNHFIWDDLHSAGFELVLLSRGWASESEDAFVGTRAELMNDGIFAKRYYLDPLQLRYSGKDTMLAYAEMCLKIAKHEKVDAFFICESIEFAVLAKLIKQDCGAPLYLFLDDERSISRGFYDIYRENIISVSLPLFDLILINSKLKSLINLTKFDNICPAKAIKQKPREICDPTFHGIIAFTNHSLNLDSAINCITSRLIEDPLLTVVLFGQKSTDLENLIKTYMPCSRIYLPDSIQDALALIIAHKECIDLLEAMNCDTPFERIQLLYLLGIMPFVRENTLNRMEKLCNLSAEKVGDDYYKITYIDDSSSSLAEILLTL